MKPAIELPPELNPNDPRVEPPSGPGRPGVPTEEAPPDTRRELPQPARRAPGAEKPAGDPKDPHQRKTGDNPPSQSPLSGLDPNHPFFDPAPEPVTPSIDDLLGGLSRRPFLEGPAPTGPSSVPPSIEDLLRGQ